MGRVDVRALRVVDAFAVGKRGDGAGRRRAGVRAAEIEVEVTNIASLAQELLLAYDAGTAIAVPPSARDTSFSLDDAYAVEAELVRLRRAAGHRTVGRKV